MVREISPPQAKYMTAPLGGLGSSRIPVASSGTRASTNKTPAVRSSSSSSSTQSSAIRKRAVLGERNDLENTPPGSHTASRTKGVKAKVASSTKFRTPIVVARVTSTSFSSSAFSTPRPTASVLPRRSLSSSMSARPRDSLSMSTLTLPMDPDMTQLLDVEPPSFAGLSSPGLSELDEERTPIVKQKTSMGPGRLLTPENSQENTIQPGPSFSSINLSSTRLPTPPASQISEETTIFDSSRTSRIRPRPAPTPPRQINRVHQAEDTTPDPSPNPRKKKSPRVVDAVQSPSRPSSRSPRSTPLDGLARFTGHTPHVAPSTPTAAELSQSIRTIVIPSTAPAASRRSRISMAPATKAAPRTSMKPKTRKSLPAQSAATNRRTRKSMTPAAIEALTGRPIGFLEKPVEPEPGDDPLLLKAKDDDEWLQKRRLSRSQSLSSSRGSQRNGRDSSVAMSHKSASAGPSRLREVITFRDEDMPTQLSPPLESHEDQSSSHSPSLELSQTNASQPQHLSSSRDEAAELGMSLAGDAIIDLGVDSGHYDMEYDIQPGWASDNDTDGGEPEQPDSRERLGAQDDDFADDTFIHLFGRRNESERETAEVLSQTPIKSPNPAEFISTTPAFSPPRRNDPVVLSTSPRSLIAAALEDLAAAEGAVHAVVDTEILQLSSSPSVPEFTLNDDPTLHAVQEDWEEFSEVTTVQPSPLPVQSPGRITDVFSADPVAEVTPEHHDAASEQVDKIEEVVLMESDSSMDQPASTTPPGSPRKEAIAAPPSPSPSAESQAPPGAMPNEEDESPIEHGAASQGDLTEEVTQEQWDVSEEQVDLLPPSPPLKSPSHISPPQTPSAAVEEHQGGASTISQELLPSSSVGECGEEAVFGESTIDLAAPTLQDDHEEPTIESPECRSPEAIFHARDVSQSPHSDAQDLDDQLPGALVASTAALTDAQPETPGVEADSIEARREPSEPKEHDSPTLQETPAIETDGASWEDSMEESLEGIDAEADRVFSRYISIPPSPHHEPASVPDPQEERFSSPPPRPSLLAPTTPISARKSPLMTPQRFLGSPYRMVISPQPKTLSAPPLVESPRRSPRIARLRMMDSPKMESTEQIAKGAEEPEAESPEDASPPEEAEVRPRTDVPAILEPTSPVDAEGSSEQLEVNLMDEQVQEAIPDAADVEGDGNVAPGYADHDLGGEENSDQLPRSSDQTHRQEVHDELSHTSGSTPSQLDRDEAGDRTDQQPAVESSPLVVEAGTATGAITEEDSSQTTLPDDAAGDQTEDAHVEKEEEEEDDCDDQEEEEEEAPLARKSSRIVVRVVSRGIVKVERPSDPSEIVPLPQTTDAAAHKEDEAEKTQEASTTAMGESLAGALASGSSGLSDVPVAGLDETAGSASAPAESSASILTENRPTQSTVAERPSTSDATSQCLPTQSSPSPPVHRFANASGGAVSSLESMLVRRQSVSSGSAVARPSRLSLVASAEDAAVEEAHSEATLEPRRHARRSLGDELAHATVGDSSFQDGDESFRSVVEVSSMDPRAAARAAAILKLNHAYIEHGILPSSTTPSTSTVPLPTPSTPGAIGTRTPRSERRRKAFESRHFATAESARKLNPEELLYEAELEIVQSRRSRSRSRAKSLGAESTATGWESDETEYALPGGWKRTPGQKRKRSKSLHRAILPSMAEEQAGNDEDDGVRMENGKETERQDERPWGIPEWKRLEKTFRKEKEAWTKERAIKPLPGLFGWAKKALTGAVDEPKEWDNERVVRRFVEEEHAQGLGGEWAEKMIRLRVKALEKRVNAPRPEKDEKEREDPDKRQGKKPRVEEKRREQVLSTPRRPSVGEGDSTVVSIVPPSTIRRMLGYVWSRSSGDTSVVDEGEEDESFVSSRGKASAADPSSDEVFKDGPAKRVENKLLTRLKEVRDKALPPVLSASTPSPLTAPRAAEPVSTPMRQVANQPVTPAHPSSPAWRTPPIPGAFRSAFHATATAASASTPSAGRPALTSTTGPVTPKIYPSLNPPFTQRSSAIKALFDTPRSSPSTASKPVAIPAKKDGSKKVSDLVRSFEEEGTFARSYEKERSKEELRRVQSRGS